MMNLYLLLVVTVLVELAVSTVRKTLREIPVPLIFAGTNRHKNEYRMRQFPVRIDSERMMKIRSVFNRDTKFWDEPIHAGASITNDEYMRHVVQGGVGP